MRLYEAGKLGCDVRVTFQTPVRTVFETDLLEGDPRELRMRGKSVRLRLRAFEIKTLRCEL